MKSRLVSGLLLMILGVIIAIGPMVIFPVCGVKHSDGDKAQGNSMAVPNEDEMVQGTPAQSTAHKVMRCFWTSRAEMGLGALISITSVLLIVLKSKKIRIGLSISTALHGILALLIPTVLIGVCDNHHMHCRIGTLPALVILSSLVIAISIINIIFLLKFSRESMVVK